MINIVGKRLWFFTFSAILFIISIVSLTIFGLNPGIDFASGSVLTIKFDQVVNLPPINQVLNDIGYTNTIEFDAHYNVVIRTEELTTEQKNNIKKSLITKFGNLTELGFESIDPLVARQTTRAAIIATISASIAILLYIAFAFRKVEKPFNYGFASVTALLLDCIVVLGVFSILGKIADWEVDLALVTGILTVIGYSINDTIVVFDRIRENHKKYPTIDFETVVNHSLKEVVTREIITGLGVLFVLIALLLGVGPTIKNLVVVLMVGIYFGTFTSMFVAAPLLVALQKRELGAFFPKKQTTKRLVG